MFLYLGVGIKEQMRKLAKAQKMRMDEVYRQVAMQQDW